MCAENLREWQYLQDQEASIIVDSGGDGRNTTEKFMFVRKQKERDRIRKKEEKQKE